MAKVGKMLEIVKTNEICSCNICSERHSNVEKIYEVKLGTTRHHHVTTMCKECLNEFADVLWRHLEQVEK